MSKKDTFRKTSSTYYRKNKKRYSLIALRIVLIVVAAIGVVLIFNQKEKKTIAVNNTDSLLEECLNQTILTAKDIKYEDLAKSTESNLSVEPTTSTEEQTTNNVNSDTEFESTNASSEVESTRKKSESSKTQSKGSKQLKINFIPQMSELPSGCEITSLTMELNYYGFQVDKCTLADSYLPIGPVNQVSLDEYFMGNPHDSSGYGCNSPVIVKTAKKYLTEQKKYNGIENYTVSDVTGTSFQHLFSYIDKGIPVIIWATENMSPAGEKVTWTVNGKECNWIRGEHCLVLIGYDNETHKVRIADPLRSIVDYDISDAESAYNQLGKQAVIISK